VGKRGRESESPRKGPLKKKVGGGLENRRGNNRGLEKGESPVKKKERPTGERGAIMGHHAERPFWVSGV